MRVSSRGPAHTEDKAAYRRFVLAHHPDRGGDPEAFVAGLRAWRPEPATGGVCFYRRPRGLGVVAAWWRARRQPPRVG